MRSAWTCAWGTTSRLDDQSLLPDGAAITDGEERAGAPGQPAEVAVPPGSLRRSRAGQTALFTAAAFGLAYVCVLFMALPALPIMWLWLWAVENDAAWLALFVNIAALPLLVAISCLWVALLKAMLLWRAAPGIYDLYSFYYLRHWLAYGLMRGSRALLLPVFTTLYLPPLMRLLGARIGRNAELSTVWSFTPDIPHGGGGQLLRRRMLSWWPAHVLRTVGAPCQRGRPQELRRQWRHAAARRIARRQLPPRSAVGATIGNTQDARGQRLAGIAGLRAA